jgi:hypothetical protein
VSDADDQMGGQGGETGPNPDGQSSRRVRRRLRVSARHICIFLPPDYVEKRVAAV